MAILLCLGIIASCDKDKCNYGSGDKKTDLQKGEGSVDFKLNTVYGVSPKSGNPASELNLNPDDFAVEFFNFSNVKKWNEIPSQVLSATGNERRIKITSLEPGTSYQFRAVYLLRTEIASGVLSGATEAGAQLPNGRPCIRI